MAQLGVFQKFIFFAKKGQKSMICWMMVDGNLLCDAVPSDEIYHLALDIDNMSMTQ